MLKVCSKCKRELDIDCFCKRKGSKDGLSYRCKQCQSIMHKKWYKKNIEHVKQYRRQWKKNNPEYSKQYHYINKSKRLKQYKAWRKNNVGYFKQWREDNLEKDKKQKVKYNNSFAFYDNYVDKLGSCEETRRAFDNFKLLEVRCAYCGRWIKPTVLQTRDRIVAINGEATGEKRFYCSENCKIVCPIYNQKLYPKGFKHATSREVVPLLRQIVLERDEYSCQICGLTIDEIEIHVHHILSYALNKMLANDPDYCVSLCKNCHKWIHQQDGCKYHELRCSEK